MYDFSRQIKKALRSPIFVLTMSVAVGHLISLAVLSVSTRVLPVELFGEVAVISSCAVFMTPIACLRIEQKLLLVPEWDVRRIILNALSTGFKFLAGLWLLIWAIQICFFDDYIFGGVIQSIVVTVVCFASIPYQIFVSLIQRTQKLNQLAKITLLRIVSQQLTIIAFIFFGDKSLALLAAEFVFFALPAVLATLNIKKAFAGKSSDKSLMFTGVQPPDLIKQDLLSTAINSLNGALPLFMVGVYLGAEQAGYFAIASRFAHLPIGTIGRATAHKFTADFSALKRNQQQSKMKKRFFQSLAALIISALALYGVGFVFYDELITFVVGDGWQKTSSIFAVILPWVFIKFIFSPVSSIFLILSQTQLKLFVDCGMSLLLASLLFFCYLFDTSEDGFYLYLSIANGSAYLVLIAFSFVSLQRHLRHRQKGASE
ncbi:MAG: oligosaccharide flippase family protein [Flavobacteriaceae bacterium]